VHTIANSIGLRIRLSSGQGVPPKVLDQTVIANKIPWRDDPAALVIGPTGVGLAPNRTCTSQTRSITGSRRSRTR
jgi:hypothetical protein